MKKLQVVSIVVPVYNEEKTIHKILERVLNAETLGLTKDIIIVNDGSSDRTKQILSKIKDKRVRVYNFPSNHGKGSALRHGFEMSTGEIVLVQDADLEYNPSDYPKLLSPILSGKTDVVYGSRMLKHGKMQHGGIWFYIGGQVINLLTNALYHANLTDEATGYKVFKSEILKSIPLSCKRFDFCPEITAKLANRGIPIHEVSISYKGRKVSEGKKINWRDGIHAVWTLLKYKFERPQE